MKIRKKSPKPASSKPPLYVVGYRGVPPSLDELTRWYDFHYGGPLVWADRQSDGRASASHGPWRAHLLTSLPETEATQWQSILTWEHPQLGVVSPSATSPGTSGDTVLVASRLARGLTLLTDGTAFDVTSHEYLNPSDWNDRPLTVFLTRDHVTVQHKEADDPRSNWFYTLGLTKFGLDELEFIQPRGLPEADAIALLESSADEALRKGQNPKVGSTLDLFALARTIHVIKHGTSAPTGRMIAFRQIATEPR